MSIGGVLSSFLSTPTQFFGLKLWITCLIGLLLLLILLLLLLIIIVYVICSSSTRRKQLINNKRNICDLCSSSSSRVGLTSSSMEHQVVNYYSSSGLSSNIRLGSGIHHHVVDMQQPSGSGGRCRDYSATELHLATDGFSLANMMIGSSSGSEVYRGILLDGQRVAVKTFTISCCNSENNDNNVDEFIEQVEAIWRLRHKNLVKLLGYSIQGAKRLMLVYDYIDNGDLHQWLHGRVTTRISPLTWNIRMNIISGITKGLVYLHEDSEPIVIHQRLKSSCILLDRQWNPRISYIGITNLLEPQSSMTRFLNGSASGYAAPEYIFTHNFNEKSDIYSFGVLIMEIITGRMPIEIVEFGRKEYLVEWLKSKVRDQKMDDIIDPNLAEVPSLKELKRIILIALRCVDPEVENRPTIGDIIHMLQPCDLLLDDDSVTDST
ncbi:hypothetical protein SSX86_018053 [Deinandra increscens subsp. villosa]|uniref:non-specific serine/threonine protein kinase n=1 Tax=Deinandra increscens subsp. villosa TaxID=3103831 RepID=A0AAP0CUL6_9ASTR